MKKLLTIFAVLAISTTAWGQWSDYQDFSSGVLPAGWGSNNGTEVFVPVSGASDSAIDGLGTESSGPATALNTVGGGGGHFDPVVTGVADAGLWTTRFTLETGIEDFAADGSNIEFGPDLGVNCLDVTDFDIRPGTQATHITSMAKIAVVNDGTTQRVELFAPLWGSWGAGPDLRHYITSQGCLVDYQDLDNDGAVMEFDTSGTSHHYTPGVDPFRQKLVLASGLPQGAIDITATFDPRSGGVADETSDIFMPGTGQKENMQQEYIDMDVTISVGGTAVLDKNGSSVHSLGVARVPWMMSWYGNWATSTQYFGGGQFDYANTIVTNDTTNPLIAYDPSTYMVSLAGDATRDGAVDGLDISKLVNGFGVSDKWGDGDFNGDGVVDGLDISILVNQFGLSYASEPLSATVVPEPATMALLGLGGLAVLRRRRK